MALARRQSRLRQGWPDADEQSGVNRDPAPRAKFTGNQQRLIIGALCQTLRMERDRDNEIRNPCGSALQPGSIKEFGERPVKSETAVKLEAVDRVAQGIFIKSGSRRPQEVRRMQKTLPTDMIPAANRRKRESATWTARRREGETSAPAAGAEIGIKGGMTRGVTQEAQWGEEKVQEAIDFGA